MGSKFMQKLIKLGPQSLLPPLHLVCHEGESILHTSTAMTFCFTTAPESVMPRTALGFANLENTGRASSSFSSLKSFLFETGSHAIAQASLEFFVLQSLKPAIIAMSRPKSLVTTFFFKYSGCGHAKVTNTEGKNKQVARINNI